MKRRLSFGVGVNDADYAVRIIKETIVEGKRKQTQLWCCPYYTTWYHMLERGYSPKLKEKYPTYKDCFVSDAWLLFSNFKSWMELQKWEGNQLDKDILFPQNKEYSEDTCIFVPSNVNSFLIDRAADRGDWPIGTYFNKKLGKFVAKCSNGKAKQIYLGLFNTADEAHLAWKVCKHSLAMEYADTLELDGYDERLIQALRTRYL